ncbi:MAG: hypothetical protein M1833_001542 [Piccolia ochrophora]|nr:MAG: hypothetical protein M1833_001542 [Piccolia ochrophora]
MPGRVSTRPGRPSATASSRKSSPPALQRQEPNSSLTARIGTIFADAQRTTTGQRKLAVNLRKVQEACCYEPQRPAGLGPRDHSFDEEDFNAGVGRCVVRLMGVKKSEGAGDKVVRFVGLFLKLANERDLALLPELAADDAEALPETPSSRLTSHILNLALQFLDLKEKTVRYRSTQLISHIINVLESIDDDLFQVLRLGLLKRAKDKESMIRVQAILGLGRLAGNETEAEQNDGDSEDEGSGGLLERLLEVLQNDQSADVRRSLLLNLPITPGTLPYLLERARDQDAATRRALYSRLLPALGDFRHLSLSMREKLLRWGLRDRDENVRKAAGKLFRERWIEDCAGTQEPEASDAVTESRPPKIEALLELLERIDVVNSGVETGVALEAMKGFWEGRSDYREAMVFDEGFWDNLTAESAFIIRSFNSFCLQDDHGRYESLLERKMPEVTRFTFYVQRYIGRLVESLAAAAQQEEGLDEEDLVVEQEFVVEQLLQIARTLDYTDEVGRRKTFALMRESLAISELPEEVTKLIVEVLRGVCGKEPSGEREFCGVVLEAVAEVHDTIMGDFGEPREEESFHSARSELNEDVEAKEKRTQGLQVQSLKEGNDSTADKEEQEAIREIMVNMKCLHIAQCMLENVEGHLQNNEHLVTMLNNLVVPAVRSHEAPIRERGLLCLGLCCLLDKTLAEENLTLFLHCFNKGHDALQVSAIHVLSDILMVHGSALLNPDTSKPLFKAFARALKADDKADVQAAACTTVCKLMLGGVLKDDDLLRLLVVVYFDPETAGNLGLRQALSYFLPVYCHSRKEGQERMQRVAVLAIHALMLINESVDEEADDMVTLSVIAAHLVDWTDPRKLVLPDTESGLGVFGDSGRKEASRAINGDVHLDLAVDALEKICASSCNRDEKKIYAGLLTKLYITPHASPERLQNVFELASNALENKAVADATSRNALNKLLSAVEKIIRDKAEARGLHETVVDGKGLVPETDPNAGAPNDNRHCSEPEVPVPESLLEDTEVENLNMEDASANEDEGEQ